MTSNNMFFPKLKRRESYSIKPDGTYYEYGHYREEIRQDSVGRCVYCDTHENEIGGQEAMELDHFRPKKYPEHSHLIHDPSNLVWSCGGCNRLKSDHWPALGTTSTVLDGEGILDPFGEDRRDYFLVQDDGGLVPIQAPAQYMVTLLALNRPTRQRLRQKRTIGVQLCQEIMSRIRIVEDLLATELTAYQQACLMQLADSLREMSKQISCLFIDFDRV